MGAFLFQKSFKASDLTIKLPKKVLCISYQYVNLALLKYIPKIKCHATK